MLCRNITVAQVPCLLSRVDATVPRAAAGARQTAYTVEAISLDGCASWFGINQCHVVRCGPHCSMQPPRTPMHA